jgi:[methyl-Co(III) methanol-specific corrinoid protein]:coenzyme M methyltransferase
MKKYIMASPATLLEGYFMTPRDEVLSALRGEAVGKVPASSVTQVGIVQAMEQIGAVWPQAHYDPEKMARVGTALYKMAGLKTARIPFCLTVEAEAMGADINIGTIDKQPSIARHPFAEADQVAIPPDFLYRGRIQSVLAATKLLKQNVKDLPVIVGTTGPFTLAGHLIGIEKYLLWTIKARDNVVKVLDVANKACIEYTKAILDAGADVVSISDPSASPELMSPRDFASLVKPKLIELSNTISTRHAVGVLHICGMAQKIIKDMAATGFDALSIEEKVDIAAAKQMIGSKPTMVGNVSAARTLFSGTPDAVREETKRAIAAGINVVAPGCGIAPRTPLANIQALVSAAQ